MARTAQAARRADRLVGALQRHKFKGREALIFRVIRRVQKLTGASQRQES